MSQHLLSYVDILVAMSMQYIPQVLLALITLLVGFRLVRWVIAGMDKAFIAQKIDPSLRSFLESMTSIGLKIMVLITVAMMVGVQMTSFIALLGAAGLAVGLSLQGSLSNLAGGILILLFKPFLVGDDIEAQGQHGVVQKIEIIATHLRGEDGRVIIVPNGILSNGVITNHSRK